MAKVEMFFDHSCPYCLKGHEYLMELLPKHPDIEILWRPVEAHPKIEEPGHRPYMDKAVQGQLIIRDRGGDELKYIEAVYRAYFKEQMEPDDISVLTKCAKQAGADVAGFEDALRGGGYEKAGHDANDYAYEQKDVWAVPTFICSAANSGAEKRLDAVPGVGITKTQLDEFFASLA